MTRWARNGQYFYDRVETAANSNFCIGLDRCKSIMPGFV